MCGIVGIINHNINASCNEAELIKMRDLQIHRGPDDAGAYVNKNVGLAHRRLSIIDLSGGHQPMTNQSQKLWIVFNGEIYNFKEIRNNLIKKGHKFKTVSDTETILHLYKEKGENCVHDLHGMFAFAIWNENDKTLFLARDRIGIKPLYYTVTKNSFIFSSEIKSILKHKSYIATYDETRLSEYFLFREIAGENTLFKNIKSLKPGHSMTLKEGKLNFCQYWSPFPQNNLHLQLSPEETAERLEGLLKDAVKDRLMSDVALGTFCSGGIDSSLVTAMASEFTSGTLNTFSVGFHEKDYDETNFAQIVSQKYNTQHHEIKVSNIEFADLLPDMIWQNDLPLNFANSIQIYAISKLAKEFVTVVLTGEGSDELFAGYPRYHIPNMVLKYKKLPALFRIFIKYGSKILNDHRLEKIEQNYQYSLQDLVIHNASQVTLIDLMDIMDIQDTSDFDYRRSIYNQGEDLGLDITSNLSLQDQHNYLLSILNRQDKMSMAASIESRVPFLDHRLIEFANKISPQLKNKGFGTKRILKKIALSYLPEEIVNRRKSGFGVPLDKWFRDKKGMGRFLESILDANSQLDIFKRPKIEKLVNDHKSGINDNSDLLWELVNFKIWREKFSV